MYAVMENQNESADIIYEFSSLLRNNISDSEKRINKWSFIGRYSCMVPLSKIHCPVSLKLI